MSEKRDIQVVECCGHRFMRWKLAGKRRFPGTHHTHCCWCKRPLPWPRNHNTWLRVRKNQRLRKELAYHAERRERNRAAGLTHDGRPRQRGPWHRYPDLDRLPPRERAVKRVQRWRKRERYARGLTQFGTPRRGRQRPLPPREAAWREFRATIDVTRPEILGSLEREAA